jgi:Ca2+-binding EF-hand superfamily protein
LTWFCLACFPEQLVAKLKSIFDRFDAKSVGRLNGAEVEQMLVYMNRPVESVQVHEWLQRLKDKEDAIEFPEFVAQYSVGAI